MHIAGASAPVRQLHTRAARTQGDASEGDSSMVFVVMGQMQMMGWWHANNKVDGALQKMCLDIHLPSPECVADPDLRIACAF